MIIQIHTTSLVMLVHGGVMVEETDYVLDDMSVCTL